MKIVFNVKQDLLKHYYQIHNICMHKCNVCSRSFQNKYTLAIHNDALHGGKNKFNCNSGKSFSSRASLKTHIYVIHEGHKDYKCESCDISFSNLSN